MSQRKIKKKVEKFSAEDKKIIKLVLAGKGFEEVVKELGLNEFESIDRIAKLVGKVTSKEIWEMKRIF